MRPSCGYGPGGVPTQTPPAHAPAPPGPADAPAPGTPALAPPGPAPAPAPPGAFVVTPPGPAPPPGRPGSAGGGAGGIGEVLGGVVLGGVRVIVTVVVDGLFSCPLGPHAAVNVLSPTAVVSTAATAKRRAIRFSIIVRTQSVGGGALSLGRLPTSARCQARSSQKTRLLRNPLHAKTGLSVREAGRHGNAQPGASVRSRRRHRPCVDALAEQHQSNPELLLEAL